MNALSYQLYSSRNFPDLQRQAAMLAGLGVRHVEPFGGLFTDPSELAEVLAEHGLSAPTAHVGAPSWRNEFDRMACALSELKVSVAIMPGIPAEQQNQDREGWQRLGAELLGYAHRLRDRGLRFGWHNHAFELQPLPDGSRPLDWILGDDPELLFELDIAWAVRGGADPAALARRYGERVVAFHLKDLAPPGECADEDGWADVGHGTIEWPALLPVLRATPDAVWVLEHDNPKDDRRFAERSLAAVRGW